MPQSSRTRRGPKNVNKKNPVQQILEQARSIDRRRQAQIANQVASINRLLKSGEYGEEMKILHMAAAQYKVENEDLTAALRQLVSTIDALPLDGLRLGRSAGVTAFAEALAQARAIITPASDPIIKTELIPGIPYHGPFPVQEIISTETPLADDAQGSCDLMDDDPAEVWAEVVGPGMAERCYRPGCSGWVSGASDYCSPECETTVSDAVSDAEGSAG